MDVPRETVEHSFPFSSFRYNVYFFDRSSREMWDIDRWIRENAASTEVVHCSYWSTVVARFNDWPSAFHAAMRWNGKIKDRKEAAP